MIIAVASGKGGTGKTTIATNLAAILAERGERVAYVDCDVEEPNGHIFLQPSIRESQPVSVLVPQVDESRCNFCGACRNACRFSAIMVLPNTVLTFPKLCHGCGGCSLACPLGAIREVPRPVGVVETGVSGPVGFVHGKLDIGEAMAPPVIRAVLDAAPKGRTLILDAPPGTSCPVIESIKNADVVLLVTEPTPFGLNDLKLAVETVRKLGLPFGVAVNRAGTGDREVYDYCGREHIPVVLEMLHDRGIAQAYSRGELAAAVRPQLKPLFVDLYAKLWDRADTVVGRVAPRPIPQQEPTASIAAERAQMPSELLPQGSKHNGRELVVISGKGGTGKTSIAASLFAIAKRATVADCDVDAADLHLVLDPKVRNRWPFYGGDYALVDEGRCVGCGTCSESCRFAAIHRNHGGSGWAYEADPISCEGCGVCADTCPENAILMMPSSGGDWFVSDTRCGPMVHARLGIAQDNSGRLVSLVRREANALRTASKSRLLICDGSPGIGCPVIASVTGATAVLVVTEPTLSGLNDLRRVAELTRQFDLPTAVCINKADINPEISTQIESEAAALNLPVLGRIRYDEAVTAAQVRRKAVVEDGDSPAARDIEGLWRRLSDAIPQLTDVVAR